MVRFLTAGESHGRALVVILEGTGMFGVNYFSSVYGQPKHSRVIL
jgi:hypothetical protein